MTLFKKLFLALQHLLPQHLLSRLLGKLAESSTPWLKDWLIQQFLQRYPVDMQSAMIENPQDYPTFNSFFTRQLKPSLRPIVQNPEQIACPVDGCISEWGTLRSNLLLQAKNFYFDLETLLGACPKDIKPFYDGSFATFYLAPHNYHRVHMPFSGQLRKTIYIPGKLFSVNRLTTDMLPGLYSRNERLVCFFDTAIGNMAVIFVGAMVVGSIQTVWEKDAPRATRVTTKNYQDIAINRGEEIGYFKVGSTVIVLFEKDKVQWNQDLHAQSLVLMGQEIGTEFA